MSAPITRWLVLNREQGPTAPFLDLSTGGTFARALAAYQYTQAPTDGSSAFLQSVASGTRRSADNRGDGLGASLLIEKGATNYLLRSRELSDAAWANAADVTANQNGGPLADGGADRINHTSGIFGPRPNAASPGPGGRVVASVWVRAVSGTGSNQFYVYHNNASAGLIARVLSTTTTYQRNDVGDSATTNSGLFVSDGRDLAGLGVPGGTSAHAEDHYFDMVQLEAGHYPTSPIDTAGSDVTRPADTLSYATGAYPAGFLTNGVVIVFAPDASSAEIVSAAETWSLVANGADGIGINGGNDCVRFKVNSGHLDVELLVGGAIKGTLTVTFSRAQKLTITAKPSAGTITVAGATTGDGTNGGSGAAWASGQTLYIGGNSAGAKNVTGRYVGASIVEAA